jgi:transcriptional regulator with XRE-family HTH domain
MNEMPSRPLHEIVAENVRDLRKRFGMTQTALADQMGCPQPNIARIERGERSLNSATIDAWADSLGVPVASLVTQVDRPAEVDAQKSSPVA